MNRRNHFQSLIEPEAEPFWRPSIVIKRSPEAKREPHEVSRRLRRRTIGSHEPNGCDPQESRSVPTKYEPQNGSGNRREQGAGTTKSGNHEEWRLWLKVAQNGSGRLKVTRNHQRHSGSGNRETLSQKEWGNHQTGTTRSEPHEVSHQRRSGNRLGGEPRSPEAMGTVKPEDSMKCLDNVSHEVSKMQSKCPKVARKREPRHTVSGKSFQAAMGIVSHSVVAGNTLYIAPKRNPIAD